MLIKLSKLPISDKKIGIRERIPRERCKGVHCVDLGEGFPTSIDLQNLASIQPRTSLVKFARPLAIQQCSQLLPPRPGRRTSSVACPSQRSAGAAFRREGPVQWKKRSLSTSAGSIFDAASRRCTGFWSPGRERIPTVILSMILDC